VIYFPDTKHIGRFTHILRTLHLQSLLIIFYDIYAQAGTRAEVTLKSQQEYVREILLKEQTETGLWDSTAWTGPATTVTASIAMP
jgi:hypothetical protein